MPRPEQPVLFHNPRCSKSREALALLRDRGVEVDVVEYLRTPLADAEIKVLAKKLGGKPSALLRSKESEYAELGLTPESDLDAVADAIARHPVLLERPILVVGSRAVIGRPPEDILRLLD